MKLSFDDEESFKEAAGSLRFNHNPSSDPNTLGLQRVGSSSSLGMPSRERNEDICFNNHTSDPSSTFQQVGISTVTMPPHERIEVT